MNNALRYCEACNGYSAPQANVDVRGGRRRNIGPLVTVVVAEQELRRLYSIEKEYGAICEELQRRQMIAPNDAPNMGLFVAQIEERVVRRTQQHMEDNNARLESLNRQLQDQESAYDQLFHQNSRLKERLEYLESHDTAIGALRSRGLLEDNRQQRGGEGLLSTDAALILQTINNLEQTINNLERRIQEDSFKIRHLEAIIDMQNCRLQDKDRSYNRLMVMHRTMMKEE